MTKRPQQHAEPAPDNDATRLPLRTTQWFDDAVARIGKPTSTNRVRLATQLQKFQAAWSQNIPLVELRKKPWQCKQVWDTPACRPNRVYQLTVNRDVRVWFTVVPSLNAAFYLDVEHKQGKPHSSDAIVRCRRRARIKWEEKPA